MKNLEKRKRDAREMYRQGLSYRDIGRKLGVSKTSVQRYRDEARARGDDWQVEPLDTSPTPGVVVQGVTQEDAGVVPETLPQPAGAPRGSGQGMMDVDRIIHHQDTLYAALLRQAKDGNIAAAIRCDVMLEKRLRYVTTNPCRDHMTQDELESQMLGQFEIWRKGLTGQFARKVGMEFGVSEGRVRELLTEAFEDIRHELNAVYHDGAQAAA